MDGKPGWIPGISVLYFLSPRELFFDGNDLGCEGLVALIEPLAEQADGDAINRRAEKKKKMAELAAEQEAKTREEGTS